MQRDKKKEGILMRWRGARQEILIYDPYLQASFKMSLSRNEMMTRCGGHTTYLPSQLFREA
jgi:hypothetical protein